MKKALHSLMLFGIIAILASCSSSLNTLQSNKDVGGADEYAALEQPIPPSSETDALAQVEDEAVAEKGRKWGKKAKGLFAGIALKKAAKKLVPADNLASENGQQASVLQILLIILLVLLILWLLGAVVGFGLIDLLISLAVLVLLILLILYLLGEL